MDPSRISPVFQAFQWLLLVGVILLIIRFLRSQEPESRFKPRPKKTEKKIPRSTKKEPSRILLQGVVLTGLPHQILGIREDASEFEIRKAHRTLIKRFHPDKVGPEGSRQWYEAQRASEAINGAREQMLRKLKKPSP